jgi:alkylation response protein AidB-like acyl-CoA dehydrogenase
VKIELTARQQQRKERFRGLVADHIAPIASDIDKNEHFPISTIRFLARSGLLGSLIPSKHGGRNFDMVSYGLLHEEIGKACSSTRSLLTVHDMVTEAIYRLGNRNLRETWLPRLASGEKIGAFALTESEAGSDTGSLRTLAAQVDGGFVLNGSKKWISFAQLANVFLVIARIGKDGPNAAILVPADSPGLSIVPITGMLGLLAIATALQLGRYSVAWGCVGIGEACVAASYRYSNQREQFGKPIADHQLIRRMLTNMLAELRAARLLCYEAGYLTQQRRPAAVNATLVAKYFASRMANRAARDAVQIQGARGTHSEQPVERYFRDARIMEIIEGSTELQQLIIPKHARQTYS